MALHLLERHFAPGLHEEILEAVGFELSTPGRHRRRYMAIPSRGARGLLCRVLRLRLCVAPDALIAVDAARIRWHAHGGPDEVPKRSGALRPAPSPVRPRGHHGARGPMGAGSAGTDGWVGPRPVQRPPRPAKCGCRLTNSPTRAPSPFAGTTPRLSRARYNGRRDAAAWKARRCGY